METKFNAERALPHIAIESPETTSDTTKSEKEINLYYTKKPGIKSINFSGDRLVITEELSGVYCEGVQYYDLKNILFINNTGMANLIDLLKSLLKDGVEVEFVNVSEKIKEKIRSMGLDNIINCH